MTFTRTGLAWQKDSSGVWQSVADGVIRDGHYVDGLRTTRIDPVAVNRLFNSQTPATQTRTLLAGTYCLWMEGSGSTTLSGGPTGVATANNPVVFTLAVQTDVTFTTAGINSTSRFQCETSKSPTSFIVTAAATVTRNNERLSITLPNTTVQNMTFYARILEIGNPAASGQRVFHLGATVGTTPYWAGSNGTLTDTISARLHDGTALQSASGVVPVVIGDEVEIRQWVDVAGGRHHVTVTRNRGTESASSDSPAFTMPTNWSAAVLNIGGMDLAAGEPMALVCTALAVGIQTLDTMRVLAAPDDQNVVTVEPPTGTLTIIGNAPTVITPKNVLTGLGALTLTGFVPTVTGAGGALRLMGLGVLTLTGFAPTVLAPTVVTTGFTQYLVDTFTRTVASGAGLAEAGTDTIKTWTTETGADADVNVNGSALVLTKNTGTWRGTIGTNTTASKDMYAEVSNFGAAATAFKEFALYPRFLDANNHYLIRWTNDQGITDATGHLDIFSVKAGSVARLAGPTIQARDTAFKLRAQVETVDAATVVVRLKYWTATQEPPTWDLTFTDALANRIVSGKVAMRLANEATATDMHVDNVIVQSVADSSALTLTGLAPTVIVGTTPKDVPVGLGVLTLTGFAPTLPKLAETGLGVLTITGLAPAVATPRTVLVDVGIVLLTGFAPTVQVPKNVTTGIGVLTLTGLAPTAIGGKGSTPGTGDLTLTGLAPTVQTPKDVTTGLGVLSLTGFASTVQTPKDVATGLGVLTLTGLLPTVQTPRTVLIGLGALTLTGFQPGTSANVQPSPAPGNLVLTGLVPLVVTPVNVITGLGALILTGLAPAAIGGKGSTPALGQLTLTGLAPTAVISDNKTALPGLGVLTLTGLAPLAIRDNALSPGVGALAITGVAPLVITPVNVSTGLGAVTLTGFAPTVLTPKTVSPDVTVIVMTGFAPSVQLVGLASTGLGVLTLTGFAPTALSLTDQFAQTGLGVLTLTGLAPAVQVSDQRIVLPGLGVLTLTGLTPSVQTPRSVLVGLGQLTVTGIAPGVSGNAVTVSTGTGQLVISGFRPGANEFTGIIVKPPYRVRLKRRA